MYQSGLRIRAGFQALLFSEHLGYQRHWWFTYACSPLEIACQNIFMQEVVSPKRRLIDMGQHPTGSWVHEALICLDKRDSHLIIWLPKNIQTFCHLRTLSSLSATSDAKARQAASLTAIAAWLMARYILQIKGWGDAAVVLCGGTWTRKTLPDSYKWRSPPKQSGWCLREGRVITDLYVFPFIPPVAIPMMFACQLLWWAADWEKPYDILPQLVTGLGITYC